MSKTISAFFQFIMDDPIMLGLCLAIGVLVILFIIVLLLGKKADKEEAMKDKEEELLKTQVDLKVMEENDNNSMAPLYEEVKIEAAPEAVEVPVVTDNAVSLEVPSEKVEEFTIPEIEANAHTESVPSESVPSFEDYKIEAPTLEEIKEVTGELNVVQLQDESKPTGFDMKPEVDPEVTTKNVGFDLQPMETFEEVSEPVGFSLQPDNTSEPIINEAVTTDNIEQEPIVFSMEDRLTGPVPDIIESTVNPVEDNSSLYDEDTNIFDLEEKLLSNFKFSLPVESPKEENNAIDLPIIQPAEKVVELPIIEEVQPVVEEKKEESLKDIYGYEETELPDIKVEDFSRTAIIRHIPVLDSKLTKMFEVKPNGIVSESDDNLDLPKLNTATIGTGIDALRGESFDIPKNS